MSTVAVLLVVYKKDFSQCIPSALRSTSDRLVLAFPPKTKAYRAMFAIVSWTCYLRYSWHITNWLIVSLSLGRLPKVDLIILEGEKCPSVRPYVRPSTNSFFDLNEIWYIGRGRWVMHDGMRYGRIQGQGHEPLKVQIPSIFKTYLLCHLQWELTNYH